MATDASFKNDFYVSVQYPPVAKLCAIHGNKIWRFLFLTDILNMSVSSRLTAGLMISKEEILRFLEENSRLTYLGRFKLSFSSNVTLGLLRRILFRLMVGSEGVLSIDMNQGRVVLDIGSAFKDNAYFTSAVPLVDLDTVDTTAVKENDYEDDDVRIMKCLEIASYDEYDDFNPRHPHPRTKTHRRGDSYFNSDITDIANDALAGFSSSGGLDLSAIAALALTEEGLTDEPQGASTQYLKFQQKKEEAGTD